MPLQAMLLQLLPVLQQAPAQLLLQLRQPRPAALAEPGIMALEHKTSISNVQLLQ